ELDREAAGLADAVLPPLGQAVEGHVAGRHLVPATGNADLRLVPVVVGHPDRAQHGPSGRPLEPVGDLVATRLHTLGHGAMLTHVGDLDPAAVIGDRWFTGLRDVTSDVSALDGEGLWVVVIRFEGEAV